MVQREHAGAVRPIAHGVEEAMRLLQMLPGVDSLDTKVLQDGGLGGVSCVQTCICKPVANSPKDEERCESIMKRFRAFVACGVVATLLFASATSSPVAVHAVSVPSQTTTDRELEPQFFPLVVAAAKGFAAGFGFVAGARAAQAVIGPLSSGAEQPALTLPAGVLD